MSALPPLRRPIRWLRPRRPDLLRRPKNPTKLQPNRWLPLAALWLLPFAASCASGNLGERRWERPPNPVAVAQLLPEQHDLQDCLNLLGAPLEVQKDKDNHRRILTWNWIASKNWSLSVSVPVADQSASYQYGENKRKVQQLQLVFDGNWMLLEVLTEGPS